MDDEIYEFTPEQETQFKINEDVYSALEKIAYRWERRGYDISEYEFELACENFIITYFDNF